MFPVVIAFLCCTCISRVLSCCFICSDWNVALITMIKYYNILYVCFTVPTVLFVVGSRCAIFFCEINVETFICLSCPTCYTWHHLTGCRHRRPRLATKVHTTPLLPSREQSECTAWAVVDPVSGKEGGPCTVKKSCRSTRTCHMPWRLVLFHISSLQPGTSPCHGRLTQATGRLSSECIWLGQATLSSQDCGQCTGRNKMLLPSTNLPVLGEIADFNMASLGRYPLSSKKRARWAEGFHDELNGHVFNLERGGLHQVLLCSWLTMWRRQATIPYQIGRRPGQQGPRLPLHTRVEMSSMLLVQHQKFVEETTSP